MTLETFDSEGNELILGIKNANEAERQSNTEGFLEIEGQTEGSQNFIPKDPREAEGANTTQNGIKIEEIISEVVEMEGEAKESKRENEHAISKSIKMQLENSSLYLNAHMSEKDIVTTVYKTQQSGGKTTLSVSRQKLKNPTVIANLLIEKTDLNCLKIFPTPQIILIYSPTEGYYVSLKREDLRLIIRRILLSYTSCLISVKSLDAIVKELYCSDVSFVGMPRSQKRYVALNNGVFDLSIKKFFSFSPSFFVTSKLSYDYNPEAQSMPEFDKFLDSFCDGHYDRKLFLKAAMWAVLCSKTEWQFFLYFSGPGSTGKSSIVNVMKYLVGIDSVHTTTLKAMNQDQFEIVNLIGKKLVVINDTEDYIQNMDVVKAYTGNDSLRGRKMYVQDTIEVEAEGIIVATGNSPLNVRDKHSSIHRRVRYFKTSNVYKGVGNTLISRVSGTIFKGKIVPEFPAIFNWVMTCTDKEKNYVTDYYNMVTSFDEHHREIRELMSPMHAWIQAEIEPSSEGVVFLGANATNKKSEDIMQTENLAYPTYSYWCRRNGTRPCSIRNFSETFVEACDNLGFKVTKIRRNQGISFRGFRIKPIVKTLSYQISMENEPKQAEFHPVPPRNEYNRLCLEIGPNASLNQDLYGDYIRVLLEDSGFKNHLTSRVQKEKFDVVEMFEKFREAKGLSQVSQDFEFNKKRTLTRNIKNFTKHGLFPKMYKCCGTSPRIVPEKYGNYLNSINKEFKTQIFRKLGEYAREYKMIILDLDLVSCYTCIILGLYPEKTYFIHKVVSKTGIWNFIKDDFEAQGKLDLFHKPYVKICFYASLFGGGITAMVDGIVKDEAKKHGQKESEFRQSAIFEEIHLQAKEIAAQMQNMKVVEELRTLSKDVFEINKDGFLKGPSGHMYKVEESIFRNNFANFLQSYEFSTLAQATIETKQKYPEIQVLFHFHDGNVIAVPEEKKEEIYEYLNSRVEKVGERLDLQFKQNIEIQNEF